MAKGATSAASAGSHSPKTEKPGAMPGFFVCLNLS
jgi:hypothetical protein